MRRWVALLLVAFAVVTVGPGATSAQEARMSLDDAIRGYENSSHTAFRGVTEDWSTHHVVFSHPEAGSAGEAKAQQDPRYWMQQIRRNAASAEFADSALVDDAAVKKKRQRHSKKIKRDWSVSMGSLATAGAGVFPAKFSLSTNGTPQCATDSVVYNTGLAGSVTQASIIAFNNLYKSPTCSGTVPATYWAYNTGGTIVTSPTGSFDGTQVAFVETVGAVANLVVLKWATGGTLTSPVTPTTSASYPSCAAPCMIKLPFNGSPTDTLSSPFWDAVSDTIFVGDAVGKLHKFHPVFGGGVPVEITTGGFPVTVSQSATKQALASPVYDSGTGQVFVGDGHASGGTADGEVHAILASTGALTNSQATICHGLGYVDPPLLDPAAARLYFVCGFDQAGGGVCASGVACIRQFAESFASGTAGSGEPVGTTADAHIYPGAFDNIYQTAASSSSPTGSLYVCGNPGGAPTLYRVPISANVIQTPVAVTALSSAAANCSPTTEFFNSATSTDWLFLSVTASGNRTGCSGACVYSFNATTALAAGANAFAGMKSAGGSSGIVIDNAGLNSTTVANIYYSTLGSQVCGTGGTGGCAVQATQGGLL
jgi:hypothetical protein